MLSANSICKCGSRKKYKRCCRSKDQFFQQLQNGDLPVFSRLSSTNGSSAKMLISNLSVSRGGIASVLLNDDLEISTNSVEGEKVFESTALITMPIDGTSMGSIQIAGNATVSSGNKSKVLMLLDNKKTLRSKSKTGLFAVARITHQRTTNEPYFDILFGTAGQKETLVDNKKNRPHISLYPDGNGKFIRLSGLGYAIESQMYYDMSSARVFPDVIKITSTDHQETILVKFTRGSNGETILNEITFNQEMKTSQMRSTPPTK